jgi:ribosome-associated protein
LVATKKTPTKSASGPSSKRASAPGARPQKPGAPKADGSARPPARSTAAGRPRIKATHAEGGPGTTRGDRDKRAERARATVRALGPRTTVGKKPLPLPAAQKPRKRTSFAPPAPSSAARALAIAIASAGLEKKAIGVEVIDVSGRVDYADYLVIMTGTSDRHVHSIALGIEEALKQKKIAPLGVEGLGTATWVLIDFDDVVVHVFQEDTRRLYDIEGLWMDAGRVEVGEANAPS